MHRYGDGTFEHPHDGFASRDAEVQQLLTLCDGLPFIVTEFGYPSGEGTLTEDEQAARIGQEWAFWRRYTHVAALYQINDGPNPGETYGIRRYPWDLNQWKPAAYQVPQEEPPMPDDTGKATYCISRTLSFEAPHKPGSFCTYYPKHGPTGERQTITILSIQPDGSKDIRLVAEAGVWEMWTPARTGTARSSRRRASSSRSRWGLSREPPPARRHTRHATRHDRAHGDRALQSARGVR